MTTQNNPAEVPSTSEKSQERIELTPDIIAVVLNLFSRYGDVSSDGKMLHWDDCVNQIHGKAKGVARAIQYWGEMEINTEEISNSAWALVDWIDDLKAIEEIDRKLARDGKIVFERHWVPGSEKLPGGGGYYWSEVRKE